MSWGGVLILCILVIFIVVTHTLSTNIRSLKEEITVLNSKISYLEYQLEKE